MSSKCLTFKELTGSKDLSENAFLMAAVDIVRRLSGFIGFVEQASVLRVPQEQLGQSATPSTYSDV